ncbi:hypothetical protein ACA910_012371 [Epithemia clementina (nom. ined.)]
MFLFSLYAAMAILAHSGQAQQQQPRHVVELQSPDPDNASSHRRLKTPRKVRKEQSKSTQFRQRELKTKDDKVPSASPTFSLAPSSTPTRTPTRTPSSPPTRTPSQTPSGSPTSSPSRNPTSSPSSSPSLSSEPSRLPSPSPSATPTQVPSFVPTETPSFRPTNFPTRTPSYRPSALPSIYPSDLPSRVPSPSPTQIPSVFPSFLPTREPSISPSDVPSLTPSDGPTRAPTVSPSFKPTISTQPTVSQMPSLDPLGVDETTASGGEVQSCRRDVSGSDLDQAVYVIPYTYNMTLLKDGNLPAAITEGESLIGQLVAEIMCRENAPGENFYLQRLFSFPKDTNVGSCGSTATTDCYSIDGAFTVTLRVDNNGGLRRRRLNVPAPIAAAFQDVFAAVLPSVAESLATFESTSVGSITNKNESNSLGNNTVTVMAAIVGGAAGLCLLTVLFILNKQRHARRTEQRFNGGRLDFGENDNNDLDSYNEERRVVPNESSEPTVPILIVQCRDEISVAGDSQFTAEGWGMEVILDESTADEKIRAANTATMGNMAASSAQTGALFYQNSGEDETPVEETILATLEELGRIAQVPTTRIPSCANAVDL